MPYMMKVSTAGKTVEVKKYFSARYGHHAPKGETVAPTSERVKRVNRRRAEEKLRLIMNANFVDGRDALVTLDFSPENRPESYDDMKRQVQNFLQRLRRKYKKLGIQCKYIWVGEIGPKGGVHVHMMLNEVDRIGGKGLMELWGLGATHIDTLWSHGQYRAIASYFMKYTDKTEETTGVHLGKKYNPSHGLTQPKVTVTVVMRNSFHRKVRPWKGYRLEKNKEGNEYYFAVSDITGLPYLSYTMVRD